MKLTEFSIAYKILAAITAVSLMASGCSAGQPDGTGGTDETDAAQTAQAAADGQEAEQPADAGQDTENEQAAAPVPEGVPADIYVPYVAGVTDSDGFMRGYDVSSALAIYNSWQESDGSVSFKDTDGNVLDMQGFFDLLNGSGANYVRLRVWNDPFDADGNSYGGGGNDINAAVQMGQYATNAGMKVFVDFHCSDFWADPSKQMLPKAWEGMKLEEKSDALYKFVYDSLSTLVDSGVDVGMVQIGNETTGSFCGENRWANKAPLFSAGTKAIRDISAEKGVDILAAIHFTNPEKPGEYASYARNLKDYGVDYDVFASSWYPYWHGTLDNLTEVLKNVADTYGKKVIVAETSWAYTLEDGDGSGNTVGEGSIGENHDYDFSPQGQAILISDVMQAVKDVGENGIGVFYWEPAWLPVQIWGDSAEKWNENSALWEKYGAGWASSYASEYDPNDAGRYYGGSAVDNQALFDFSGNPLPSLYTYKYVQTGTSGFDIYPVGTDEIILELDTSDTLELPETAKVRFSYGSPEIVPVSWNESDVSAVDMKTPGTYTVTGTVDVNGTSVDALCTIILKKGSLLKNPGFEKDDMSAFEISQSYASRTTDDPYKGDHGLHFYSTDIVDFTAQQTTELEAGHYTFSLYAQGGDMGDGADCYAYVRVNGEELKDSFELTGWKNWANPTIEFDVDSDGTEVTVGVKITAAQTGAWGTTDEWNLS